MVLAQQKKGIPATTQKAPATTAKPAAQTTYESLKTVPAQQPPANPIPSQSEYDKYQSSRTVVMAPVDQPPQVGTVVKLNFMRLVVGGIDVELEKRVAPKSSAILTGGYYAYGLLKGGYRLGMDYRQYLGKSYSPKGLYVSAGAMGNFVPVKDNQLIGKTTVVLLNLRALVGYQILSGHFVFDVAAGPAYGFVTSTDTFSDPDKALKVGLLPVVKLSLGYAF
ncbi:hypothetical protein DVG78_24065 [Runella aurantiaca]|uniref:DUF3575 domain-containing protein n=2 Tax=Runella aurantiaca TaxID=2282308 RepID=A0A369I7C0_9BACT|nr:hypothetical protein DVG78_24065 [Runella aurantiaca]